MVTYYTALGRMITKTEEGHKIPLIIVEGTEYQMSVDELIIWGSLHWNFLDKDAIEKEYIRRKTDNRIFNDTSFEQTLKRLEIRGLVVSGTDYLAADALYKLISKLKIRPVRFSFVDKIKSMVYLYFEKGVPLAKCYASYFGTDYTENEKSVLRISKCVAITPSEIIRCAETKIKDIKDEEDLIEKVYGNDDIESITINARFSELKSEVIKAVANLYLKKKIVFEN